LLRGDVACLLMEPALTNIGIVLPDDGYLKEVRRITRAHGVYLIIDETHTICAGPGGCTAAWSLEPDFFVIGKPIGGGMPAAVYGMSEDVARKIEQSLSADDIDVSGVGGTLTGNALALAAVRATLSSTLREQDFDIMIPLATRWAQGVQSIIDEYSLDWHVQQLGCRAEYWFCPPPRDGAEAARNIDHQLDAYLHLYALNRGFLLTPFHNMALFSPFHDLQQVDSHTEMFRSAVKSLLA
jgi:glutamate-1-semialdehyde 2,1-aminomutase